MKNLSAFKRIEEINPYLAFRLLQANPTICSFPIIDFNLKEDYEIVVADKLFRLNKNAYDFLDRGGRIVFVEKDVNKIRSFMDLEDFPCHKNLFIFIDADYEYSKLARLSVFKKIKFIGKLEALKSFLSYYHLAFSDYADLGNSIVRNIQLNLLKINPMFSGKELKNQFLGRSVIICGSGESLDKNIEFIKKHEKHLFVFAAGSAILKLIQYGVKIDAGFFIDPWPKFTSYEKLKNQHFPLFYQNRACEKVLSFHKGPKIWMGHSHGYEVENYLLKELYVEDFHFLTGWNAGNFAYETASYLGFTKFHFLGIDGGIKRDLIEGLNYIQKRVGEERQKAFWADENTLDLELSEETKKNCFFDNVKSKLKPLNLDRFILKNLLIKLNNYELRSCIENFLDKITKVGNEQEVKKASILLHAELACEIAYDYLIDPLWKLFEPFYESENKHLVISKALFAREVLKFQQKFYFYPDGSLYFKETDDGYSEIYYPSGVLKSRVQKKNGLLDGMFEIYSETGARLRIGTYKNGQKESFHKIFDDNGGLRLSAEFKEGRPVGQEIRKRQNGNLFRKVEYTKSGLFNLTEYDVSGNLTRQTFQDNEIYHEKFFRNNLVAFHRKGKIDDGKVLWD